MLTFSRFRPRFGTNCEPCAILPSVCQFVEIVILSRHNTQTHTGSQPETRMKSASWKDAPLAAGAGERKYLCHGSFFLQGGCCVCRYSSLNCDIIKSLGLKKQSNKHCGANVSIPSSTKRIKNIQESLCGLQRGFLSFYVSQ